MRRLARTLLAAEAALVGVLILRPAAQAIGLRRLRRDAPHLFDGAAAAASVHAAIQSTLTEGLL